jgi:hypothetical protein
MTDPEIEFARELEVFESEVNEAIQSFYAEQTIHNVARANGQVYDALNRHAAFWKITSRALQSNALIVLGRIFDKNPNSHGVHRLLQLAEAHPGIFSKAAFVKRKRPHAGEWTAEVVRDMHIPTPKDFKRLRERLDRQRINYKARYKPLRDKFFAHKDRADTAGLFASTNIRELEQLLCFLSGLHDALWHLLQNGIKPVVRRTHYSSRQILRMPKHSYSKNREQEWIVQETRKFLRNIVPNLVKTKPAAVGALHASAKFNGPKNQVHSQK